MQQKTNQGPNLAFSYLREKVQFMILSVGYSYEVVCVKLCVDGCELQFVCELKYLSVRLLSGKKLRLSLHELKAKFFKAFFKWHSVSR